MYYVGFITDNSKALLTHTFDYYKDAEEFFNTCIKSNGCSNAFFLGEDMKTISLWIRGGIEINMCECCEQSKRIDNGVYHSVKVEKDVIYGWCLKIRDLNTKDPIDDIREVAYQIDYCPLCGKKLT
jgi:hypothetical protein